MKVSAKIKIKGTRTLLFCGFSISALSDMKPKKGTTGNNPEEWKETVLMNADRVPFVHDTYLVRSISEGGKELKVGKSNLSKKIYSCLEVSAVHSGKIYFEGMKVPEAPTTDDTQPVYLDVRSVVNPMTKGRNVRYRIALKPGWELTFTINWDDSLVSKDQMQTCVTNGGMYQGIGDGRKIGFGRYEVVSFEQVKA